MTKLNFLLELQEKLAGLPQNEVEERLSFYMEMIEERMEEGFSEDDAVSAVGTVEEIVAQIKAELSPALTNENPKPKRRLKGAEILLLVLGSPVWISLLIAAFAVVLSLYVSLWTVIISLWAVFASLVGCAFGTIVGGSYLALGGYPPAGIALIAAGLVCAGFSLFLFFGCKYATKAAAWLTKLPFQKLSAQKEEHQ